MTRDMTHDDIREALAAEALGALGGAERERVLAHAEGCAECRALLAGLRDDASLLAYAAPARPLAADRAGALRARLLERAAAERPSGVVSLGVPVAGAAAGNADGDTFTKVIPMDRGRRGASGRAGWLAAAASVLLLLGMGAYAAGLRRDVRSLESRTAALEADRARLQDAVRARETTLASLSGPAVRVIDMAAARPADPSGRMFWDPSTARWTFFAHHLPAVRQGREYQLWLITPGRKIPSVTFRPDARGMAVVQTDYALPVDSLSAVAITEEPAGGLPEPSGAVVLAGAMSR